ncbi:MAG: hypothetical protein QM572_11525 [Nocardioides sp.]|uniref:hypothetical protein n=1 Tax=Nocardioides sp. TaxID=35761 RepID=UPI0039E3A3A5
MTNQSPEPSAPPSIRGPLIALLVLFLGGCVWGVWSRWEDPIAPGQVLLHWLLAPFVVLSGLTGTAASVFPLGESAGWVPTWTFRIGGAATAAANGFLLGSVTIVESGYVGIFGVLCALLVLGVDLLVISKPEKSFVSP